MIFVRSDYGTIRSQLKMSRSSLISRSILKWGHRQGRARWRKAVDWRLASACARRLPRRPGWAWRRRQSVRGRLAVASSAICDDTDPQSAHRTGAGLTRYRAHTARHHSPTGRPVTSSSSSSSSIWLSEEGFVLVSYVYVCIAIRSVRVTFVFRRAVYS
jgi:hypothetical protein